MGLLAKDYGKYVKITHNMESRRFVRLFLIILIIDFGDHAISHGVNVSHREHK